MSKLEPGQRVAVLIDNKLSRGTIRTVYEALDQAIVETEDGEVKKVRLSYIGVEDEEEVQEEEINAPKTITITEDEFADVACKLAIEFGDDDFLTGLAFTLFSSKLWVALFDNEGDNVNSI